jgi:hypothetical protein
VYEQTCQKRDKAMGGSHNRTKPDNISLIQQNLEVMDIFTQVGWLEFFE